MVDLLLVNCTPSPSYRLKFGSDFVCTSASWHVTGNGLAAMYLSVRVISDKSNEVLAQRSPSMVKGVGFRSLSRRRSWVQIPPSAPFLSGQLRRISAFQSKFF